MKNTIISLSIILIMVISLGAVLVVGGNTSRSNELKQNINIAAKQTMDFYAEDINVTEEAFVAMFTENLIALSDSDSAIQVNVLSIDLDNGTFSVNVKETYKSSIGTKKTIEASDTLVVDFGTFAVANKVNTECVISFVWLDKDKPVSVVQVVKNSRFKAPQDNGYVLSNPIGYEFAGWTANLSGEIELVDIGSEIATKDTTYYAVFTDTFGLMHILADEI